MYLNKRDGFNMPLMVRQRFATDRLRTRFGDVCPICVSVLNGLGLVIAVNRYSIATASKGELPPLADWDNTEFLRDCRIAASQGDIAANLAAEGIDEVLSGRSDEFSMEYAYPIDSITKTCGLLVTPFESMERGVLLSHFDLSNDHPMSALVDSTQRTTDLAMRLHTVNAFGSDVSHRLSQPLTAMTYYCSVVQQIMRHQPDAVVSRDLGKYIGKIAEQGRRATEIVDEVRQQTRLAIRPEGTIRVDAMIEDVLTIMSPLARSFSIRLEADCEAGLPLLSGDLSQIQEVILNLITNSMEALAPGHDRSPSIRVSARRTVDGIEFGVIDNGPGIDNVRAEKMFELFDTSKLGKLGFGLGISRSIVRAHDGKLWFERNPDGGAIFRFLIPADDKVP